MIDYTRLYLSLGSETKTGGCPPSPTVGPDLTSRLARPSRAQTSRGCCRVLQQIHVVAWLVHSARSLCLLPPATPIFPRAGVSGAPHAGFGKARAPLSMTVRQRAHHGGDRRSGRSDSRVTLGSCRNEGNLQGSGEGWQGFGRGRDVEGEHGVCRVCWCMSKVRPE